MLVVSEQFQCLDQMTFWWLRVGKARYKNHDDCIFKQKRGFYDGESVLYTGFQVLREEGVTAPGSGANSAPPNTRKAQMQTLWLRPLLIRSQTLIKNGE